MSVAGLQAYGVPPMPDKLTRSKAFSDWLNAVSIPNRITPVLEKTNVYHLPHRASPTNAAPPIAAELQLTESSVQAVAGSLIALRAPLYPALLVHHHARSLNFRRSLGDLDLSPNLDHERRNLASSGAGLAGRCRFNR
jgi:hypothetical protein